MPKRTIKEIEDAESEKCGECAHSSKKAREYPCGKCIGPDNEPWFFEPKVGSKLFRKRVE